MHIKKTVYEQLLTYCPDFPPESGGVLGGRNGVVTQFVLDLGLTTTRDDFYIPNVEYCNDVIAMWQTIGIAFYGILHTHPENSKELSPADRAYILSVMQVMPKTIDRLYFPLVFPRVGIRAYSAVRKENNITLKTEDIILVL